jgi:hypothetical protein
VGLYRRLGPQSHPNFASLPVLAARSVRRGRPAGCRPRGGSIPHGAGVRAPAELGPAALTFQAVDIAASAVSHFELARTMLEAGKDVYVEKPLTLRVDHAEELVALARKHQRILMVGHLLLFHPAVRYLKDMVERGDLGDVFYIYSQRVNLGKVRRDENALWSFAPHDLSVILHLIGDEPIDVVARGSAFLQGDVEDVVFVDLRFPGNKLAHLHVSWLDPHKLRKFTVVGSRKMVVFDDMEASEKIRIYDKGVDRAAQVVSYGDALTVRSGDILIPKISLQEPLRSSASTSSTACATQDAAHRRRGRPAVVRCWRRRRRRSSRAARRWRWRRRAGAR